MDGACAYATIEGSEVKCPHCSSEVNKLAYRCRCGAIVLNLGGLQPKQRRVLDLIRARGPEVATKIGAGGSRGSAKSRCGRDVALITAMEVATEIPGIAITIMRRNWGDLEENMLEKFKLERPELTQFYSTQRQAYEFPADWGGARIVFNYADHLDDVIRISRGPEYYLIIVDQSEQFDERELNELNTPNRWPGAPTGGPKTLHLFNPGGRGSEYLQRVYWLKQFKENERPSDYAFAQMFGYDNYAWFQNEGIEIDGQPLTFNKFYSLPGDPPSPTDGKYDQKWLDTIPENNRFRLFVTRTSEGRKMWAKPESIRMGDLFGRFDQFAGQYFAGVWSERACVIPTSLVDRIVQYWWVCWCGGDLGFGHHTAIYWMAVGKLSPKQAWDLLAIDTEWPLDVVVVYREYLAQGKAEADIGRDLVRATPAAERDALRKFVMGSDTKTTDRYAIHSRRQLIDAVTTAAGMPAITSAQDGPGSRVINARLLWDGLRRTSSMRSENPPRDRPEEKTTPLLLISAECPGLISAIPKLIVDPDKPDDVLKLETVADDVFDGCKYSFAEYLGVRDMAPREVRQKEAMDRAADGVQESEAMTARYQAFLRFQEEEQRQEHRARKR